MRKMKTVTMIKTDVEKRKREREKWFKGNNEQCLNSTMNLWVLKVSNWYHEFQINWRIQIGGKVFVSLFVYIIGYIAYIQKSWGAADKLGIDA